MNSIFGNFDDLVLFCQVVDAGSMQQAAQQLKIPLSTLSRRLTALEERLDVRLLERRGRVLIATETGQRFYQELSDDLNRANEGLDKLLSSKDQVRGALRLVAPYTMYQLHLAPIVEAFLTRYSDVALEVKLSMDAHLPETDRDLVISFDIGRSQTIIARPFYLSDDALFASDNYIARRGEPATPDQLESHDWIGLSANRMLNVIGPDNQKQSYRIRPRLVVNDLRMVIRAVEAGLGIGQIPMLFLPEKPLVQLLDGYSLAQRQAFLLYRRRTHQPRALSLFIDALLRHSP